MFQGKSYPKLIEELFAKKRLGIRPALPPVKALMKVLGSPHKACRFFHVAGTNGKGSTVAMTASILNEAGYKTGAFYSPHVSDYRERVTFNGKWISKSDVSATLRRMGKLWEVAKGKDPKLPEKITFFEWTAALAFCFFERKEVEVAALETGLGGRFDATNVVTPEISIITNISLEHTGILGKTVAAIAAEKAGIIKRGRPVVCGRMSKGAKTTIRKVAIEKGSRAYFLGEDFSVDQKGNFKSKLIDKIILAPTMRGRFQLDNASLAVQALLLSNRFRVGERQIAKGLSKATLPGRFETVSHKRNVIYDVAHNKNSVQQLVATLREENGDRKVDVLIGVLRDKDFREMLGALAPLTRRMLCITPPDERALPGALLAKTARSLGIKAVSLKNCGKTEIWGRASVPLLVTGSFTTVAYVKKHILMDKVTG